MFRILALKTIMQSSEKYGYHISNSSKYSMPKTTKVVVDSSIDDLCQWAKEQKNTYKMV